MVLRRRHIAKAMTWRICATFVTIIITVVATGSIEMGLIVGPIDFVVKVVLYYLHERAWLRMQFGVQQTGDSDGKRGNECAC